MAVLEDSIRIEELRARKFLGLRRSAWIELFFFFLVVVSIDYLFFHAERYFYVNPHPFWIIVILMSVQYGTNEGVLAAFLATLVLFLGNLPEQAVVQDQFDYIISLIKNPILWFISAVVIGEVRTRQIRERENQKGELIEAHKREKTIADSYGQLKKLKENMEMQIAGKLRTTLQGYEVFQQLERETSQEILISTITLIDTLLEPSKCSVFTLSHPGLQKIADKGWGTTTPKYAEKYEASSTLYQEIITKQKTLTVINEEERTLIGAEGLIAAPIVDMETEEVYGMIKIEELSFIHFKTPIVETVQLIGEWIGKAYSNRKQLEEAQKNAYLDHSSQLLTVSFFEYQRDYIIQLARRLNFDVTLLKIQLADAQRVSKEIRKKAGITVFAMVNTVLRSIDQSFEIGKQGTEFAILLEGTSTHKTELVVDKLKKYLKEENSPYQFEFQIIGLHEQQ